MVRLSTAPVQGLDAGLVAVRKDSPLISEVAVGPLTLSRRDNQELRVLGRLVSYEVERVSLG